MARFHKILDFLYKITRWYLIAMLCLVFGIFCIFCILFVHSIVTGRSSAASLISTVILVGTVISFILILRMLLKRKSLVDNVRESKLRKQTELIKELNTAKACPVCGGRLAVCEKDSQPDDLRLISISYSGEYEYYCPPCDEFFDPLQTAGEYIPEERTIPQQAGVRYHIKQSEKNKTLRRVVIFALIGLYLAIAGVRGIVSPIIIGGTSYLFIIAIFLFISLILLYFSFQLYKVWRKLSQVEYELVEDGLIIRERAVTRFFPWEDFRIATWIPDFYNKQCAYVFDHRQTVITIYSGIEQYNDLAYDIIDHIRKTAQIDSRI